MKEQLANMTIIELVRTAHSYATSIQQIDTHSAIVREMASRLEALNLAHIGGMNSLRSAISERDQLAAENAALKECRDSYTPAIDLWNRWADAEDKIPTAPETPVTNQLSIEESQFLTDVITAAGLLSHGKQDKGLARRITAFCVAKINGSNPAKLRNGEAV